MVNLIKPIKLLEKRLEVPPPSLHSSSNHQLHKYNFNIILSFKIERIYRNYPVINVKSSILIAKEKNNNDLNNNKTYKSVLICCFFMNRMVVIFYFFKLQIDNAFGKVNKQESKIKKLKIISNKENASTQKNS